MGAAPVHLRRAGSAGTAESGGAERGCLSTTSQKARCESEGGCFVNRPPASHSQPTASTCGRIPVRIACRSDAPRRGRRRGPRRACGTVENLWVFQVRWESAPPADFHGTAFPPDAFDANAGSHSPRCLAWVIGARTGMHAGKLVTLVRWTSRDGGDRL